jgi:hypothetical protein
VVDAGEHCNETSSYMEDVEFLDFLNYMELSPSWEAASCASTQEFPSILWNSKARYADHSDRPRLNAGIVGSNPTRGVYSVLFCV